MIDLGQWLDALDEHSTQQALSRCCGARRWIAAMVARGIFSTAAAVHQAAEQIWWQLTPEDWLEAFSHHPRIGDRQLSGAARENRQWSSSEQAGASQADATVQRALEQGNQRYEERFGHVFLICASGRSGSEMLAELERRLHNDAAAELREAAAEQVKITHLRLDKLTVESTEGES